MLNRPPFRELTMLYIYPAACVRSLVGIIVRTPHASESGFRAVHTWNAADVASLSLQK